MSLIDMLETTVSIYTLSTTFDTTGEQKQSKTLSASIQAHSEHLSPKQIAELNSDLSLEHRRIFTLTQINLNSIISIDSRDFNVLRSEKFLNPSNSVVFYRTFLKAVDK